MMGNMLFAVFNPRDVAIVTT